MVEPVDLQQLGNKTPAQEVPSVSAPEQHETPNTQGVVERMIQAERSYSVAQGELGGKYVSIEEKVIALGQKVEGSLQVISNREGSGNLKGMVERREGHLLGPQGEKIHILTAKASEEGYFGVEEVTLETDLEGEPGIHYDVEPSRIVVSGGVKGGVIGLYDGSAWWGTDHKWHFESTNRIRLSGTKENYPSPRGGVFEQLEGILDTCLDSQIELKPNISAQNTPPAPATAPTA